MLKLRCRRVEQPPIITHISGSAFLESEFCGGRFIRIDIKFFECPPE